MTMNDYFSLKFEDENLIILDQTKLPEEETYIKTDSYELIARAIEKLEIRGAPAIGVAAAYALALSVKNINSAQVEEIFFKAVERLKSTRPTAVNLFFAINKMVEVYNANKNSGNIYEILIREAKDFHSEDIDKCDKIGEIGSKIFTKKSNVLTHCNTGKLATAGNGTAFNVIRTAFKKGLVNFVYVDETRPLLQGARLTTFELMKNNIPFALQCDSAAAYLMQKQLVDLVIVGADRIALNGDTANKIGTYNLAVLCFQHNIPFYVAAPTTTIDRSLPTGNDIEIEFRSENEIVNLYGKKIAPDNTKTFAPAFDVTPAHLIKGIITDENIYFFPYNFMQ